MTVARVFKRCDCGDWEGCPHLVISAVLAEAVRDKKLAESPCTGIQLPGVVIGADFIIPTHAQIEAIAAGLPPDWAATVWLMHGCGLRIGEALAVNLRCRVNRDKTLRVKEQVNPAAQLKPLKFRREGEFRDIPLPQYVSEAIDKHVAGYGVTPDGYLFQGRKHKLVIRRSYQQDFQRAAAKAGLPPEFIPPHCVTSTLSLTRFDGHPPSGVLPRKDVRSWRARGRSPGGAVRSLLSSRRRSSSCASAGTGRQGRSRGTST